MEHAPNGLHVEAGELVTTGPAGAAHLRRRDRRPADHRLAAGRRDARRRSTGSQYVINRVNQLRRPGEIVLYTPAFRQPDEHGGIGHRRRDLRSRPAASDVRDLDRDRCRTPDRPRAAIRSTRARSSSPRRRRRRSAGSFPGEPSRLDDDGHGRLGVDPARRRRLANGSCAMASSASLPRPASADEIHPRSAIGLTADGRLILATVDGRQPGWSAGVRLPELAELMLSRGAVVALNLDGGGSTSPRHPASGHRTAPSSSTGHPTGPSARSPTASR